MISKESVEVVLTARSAVYRVFQNLLGNEANPETLSQLGDPVVWDILALYDEGTSEFSIALEAFRSTVEEGLKNEAGFLDLLSSSFTHLFVGPGKVEADPWESVYLDKEYTLFKPSTLEVRKAYGAQGLLPRAYPHVADDHVALELDFMAMIAERLVGAYSDNDQPRAIDLLNASKSFLGEHLMVWIPAFLKVLVDAQHAYFYKDVVLLLGEYIQKDYQMLDELLEVFTPASAL